MTTQPVATTAGRATGRLAIVAVADGIPSVATTPMTCLP